MKNTPRVSLPGYRTLQEAFAALFAENEAKIRELVIRVLEDPGRAHTYPGRLALENLLALRHPSPDEEMIAEKIRASGRLESGPFNCVTFCLYRETGDRFWLNQFRQEAEKVLRERPTSPEGAWQFPRGRLGEGHAIFLDGFQQDATRLIKLAWLIDSGEIYQHPENPDDLRAKALAQFRVHREILEDPETGLWHNGRGWLSEGADRLSPGAWSRGHGWLLRGLRWSLRYLPPGEVRRELQQLNENLCRVLVERQSARGAWHALLHRPVEESPPETSGTALIAGAMLENISAGDLPPDPFLESALRAARHVLREFLTRDGRVLNTCPGPGPLVSEDPYLTPAEFPADEPHGPPALFALWRGVEKLAIPRE